MSEDYLAWKDWREAQFGQCTPADTRYFDWHVQRAFGAPKAALRVLELGFGNGSFLAWGAYSPGSQIRVRAWSWWPRLTCCNTCRPITPWPCSNAWRNIWPRAGAW